MGNCSSQSTENSHEIDLYLKSKALAYLTYLEYHMMNLRVPEKKETTTDDPTEDYTTNDQQSPIIIESKVTPKDVASS